MKRFFLLTIALFVLFAGCASMGPVADTSIVRIVDTAKPKDIAFDLSMRWLAESFRSAKSVIEYTDKGTGTINGKGIMVVSGSFGIPVDVSFSIVIDIKDDRARLSYRALSVAERGTSPTAAGVYPEIFNKFTVKAEEMTIDYQRYLTEQKADW